MMESWRRFEKELARKLKGLITPGSGNQEIKGDVHCDIFVVEAKWRAFEYHGERYLSLQKEWLSTIGKQAASYGKEPLLAVCIANISTYYLIRYDFWLESEGRLESVTPVTNDLGDKKQFRMYAKEDFSYTIYDYHQAGVWIALPESDLMFLVKLARREEETDCKVQEKPRWKEKSESQRAREKESVRARRASAARGWRAPRPRDRS
jgi:hypothetical protein